MVNLASSQEARVLAFAGRTLDPPLTVRWSCAAHAVGGAGTSGRPDRCATARGSPADEGARSDPVRSLAAALAQGGGARTPQLPTPGAALAARLLQLIRLIDGAAADVSAEEAPLDELPHEQRRALTTAPGDLRAVAREPTPGLWRLLLPFGIPGEVGDLRLVPAR